MGLFSWLSRLFDRGLDPRELARRLGVHREDLDRVAIRYETFEIPKRSGGTRTIDAPDGPLKQLQERILHRLLAGLEAHEAAHGFERGRSIVTNARRHVRKAAVLKIDLKDFFPSTRAAEVHKLFRQVGWNRKVAKQLTTWCTWRDGLPQGAPTSPRLSNLVNQRLDARCTGLARFFGADYTRYADDLTFSWRHEPGDRVRDLLHGVERIARDLGYRVHHKKKLHLMRQHDRQVVTGLVVNHDVNLPRPTRRWLRAVEHRVRTGGQPSLTVEQIQGWRALDDMVRRQRR